MISPERDKKIFMYVKQRIQNMPNSKLQLDLLNAIDGKKLYLTCIPQEELKEIFDKCEYYNSAKPLEEEIRSTWKGTNCSNEGIEEPDDIDEMEYE